MKVVFGIYHPGGDKIKEFAGIWSKNLSEIMGEDRQIRIGWRIGSLTLEIKDDAPLHEVRVKAEEVLREKLAESGIWLQREEKEHAAV